METKLSCLLIAVGAADSTLWLSWGCRQCPCATCLHESAVLRAKGGDPLGSRTLWQKEDGHSPGLEPWFPPSSAPAAAS